MDNRWKQHCEMKKTPAALMRLYEDALNDYSKSGKTAIPASAQSIACNSCNTLANATVLIGEF